MAINAYLVLGTVGSGRLGTVYDIMENGFLEDDFCAVFASKAEPSGEFEAKISDSGAGGLVVYESEADVIKILKSDDAERFTKVVYIADSSKEFAEQIEFFKSLCDARILKLCRVWGFVDCELFTKAWDVCAPYFAAIAHFSDCLFLTNRGAITNKQSDAIREHFEKMFHPHLYVNVKKGFRVDNPMDITVDEARRITMYFDDYDPIDELELDEDDLPEEPFDLTKKPDPYLETAENGMRLKPLPDLRALREKLKNEESKS